MILRNERANLLQNFMPGNAYLFKIRRKFMALEMRPKSFGSFKKQAQLGLLAANESVWGGDGWWGMVTYYGWNSAFFCSNKYLTWALYEQNHRRALSSFHFRPQTRNCELSCATHETGLNYRKVYCSVAFIKMVMQMTKLKYFLQRNKRQNGMQCRREWSVVLECFLEWISERSYNSRQV